MGSHQELVNLDYILHNISYQYLHNSNSRAISRTPLSNHDTSSNS